MIFTVFLVCAFGLVAAEIDHDDGEYGHWNAWRKAICEKNDDELYKELDACHQMEPKILVDAAEHCSKEADPSSEGKTIPFVHAACKDISLFKKFDDCFDVFGETSDFSKEWGLTPEVEKCYTDVLEKYALQSLIQYSE